MIEDCEELCTKDSDLSRAYVSICALESITLYIVAFMQRKSLSYAAYLKLY